MDMPLAGWLLSALSFVAGTVVPVLYRRLSYDGICFRQPADIRAVTQGEGDAVRRLVTFSTVVKVANSNKASAILEDITVKLSRELSRQFKSVGVDVNLLEPGSSVHLPPERDPSGTNQLPALIKSDSERIIALGILFRYSGNDPNPVGVLANAIRETGIRVLFRINGKDRGYLLHAKPFERYSENIR